MADAVATANVVELDDRTAVRVEVSWVTDGVIETTGVLVAEIVVLDTA